MPWRRSEPRAGRGASRRNAHPAATLLNVKGIGPCHALSEWFFRHFDNQRQVSAYCALAPTPWQSGSVDREQGVSKSGNPRLRTTMVQAARRWLRHQIGTCSTLEVCDRRHRDRRRRDEGCLTLIRNPPGPDQSWSIPVG
ncbi:transposase [Mesorhizobium sp. M0518]|uniref:transposase n=1 Tax=Mesorhizobium sp. M0518 TaxID=2956956 RepID=UPI00333ABD31